MKYMNRFIYCIIISLFSVLITKYLVFTNSFRITNIIIQGNKYIPNDVILETINKQTENKNILNVDFKMIKIDEAVILIRINQAYSKDMSKQDLYSYTRGQWRLSVKRASKAKLVFSLFKGNIIEVYQIKKWVPAGVSMNRDNKLIERKTNERIIQKKV